MKAKTKSVWFTGLAWDALPETIAFTALRARFANSRFEIADARFARVIADQIMKGRIGDRPFIVLQPMRFDLLGSKMALAISTFSSSV